MSRVNPLVIVFFVAVAVAAGVYVSGASPKEGAGGGIGSMILLQPDTTMRRAASHNLIRGTFYARVPKGRRDYALTRDSVLLQLAANGSWGFWRLDPADDPRRQPK